MEIFVLHILKLNILAAVIILLVKTAALLLKDRVSVRWKYFIWLLVAGSLLIPVRFSTDISMVDLQVKKYRTENSDIGSEPQTTTEPDTGMTAGEQRPAKIQSEQSSGQKAYILYETGTWTKTAAGIFMLIWLVVAALKLTGQLLAYHISVKKLERMSLPVSDPVSLKMYREVCGDKRIRRKPQLRQNAGITTPLLAGLFHTKLYLPAVGYSAEERKLIFCHELTHYCHRDLWYKFLLRTCATVYWFNPFLLLMLGEAEKDIENLCDGAVVRGADLSEHQLYRKLLLKTVAMENRVSYVSVGLNDSGMIFKDRIRYMLNIKKLKRGFLPGILLAVLLAGGNLAFSVSAGTENAGTEQKAVSEEKNLGAEKENPTDMPFSDNVVKMQKISGVPDMYTGASMRTGLINKETGADEKTEISGEKSADNAYENLKAESINAESEPPAPAGESAESVNPADDESADAESGQTDQGNISADGDSDSGEGDCSETGTGDETQDDPFPGNISYDSGFSNASGVASIVVPGEGDTESRVLQDNGNGIYSDENGFTYRYQGDGNWTDSEGNSYRTWNDEDYNSGTYLEQHELQGSSGSVSVKQTTNGEYYYRDADGVGYIDNGDGTWTDENGNTYTE